MSCYTRLFGRWCSNSCMDDMQIVVNQNGVIEWYVAGHSVAFNEQFLDNQDQRQLTGMIMILSK